MNFFGMGPMEIILIMVIALVVFGPGKMPEIGRNVGAAIREFRRASQALTNELSRDTDLAKLKEEVNSIRTEVSQAVPYLTGGVTVELEERETKPATTTGSESAADLGPARPLDQAEDSDLGGKPEARELVEELDPAQADRLEAAPDDRLEAAADDGLEAAPEAVVSEEQSSAAVATASAKGSTMRRRLARRGVAKRRDKQSTDDGTDQIDGTDQTERS